MKTQGRKGSVTEVEVHQITSCAFWVLLKQVIRCLSGWSFTNKQEESGLRVKEGSDPSLLGGDPARARLPQLKRPEGVFREIPVAEHLACSGPARLPESQAEMLADL